MNKNESKYFNTAKKMNDALLSLLDKKHFEFITIKDICKEAHVNRSTFYLHYQNINDLLDEVIYSTNKQFITYFENNKKIDILNDSKKDLILLNDDYLIPYLTFVKNNKKIYKLAKRNSNLFNANEYSNSVYNHIISKILDRFEVKEEYKKYIFKYHIDGISSLVLSWCDNNCDLSIQDLANLIKGLVLNVKEIK